MVIRSPPEMSESRAYTKGRETSPFRRSFLERSSSLFSAKTPQMSSLIW